VVWQYAHAALQRQLLLLWRAEHAGVQLEANLQMTKAQQWDVKRDVQAGYWDVHN
jgi:hypothetical protein